MLGSGIPLFFFNDRGDIAARLDAVETGGSGYFIKPVDIALLLEILNERVLRTSNHRILIVDDALLAAREIARWLDSRGMATQVPPNRCNPASHRQLSTQPVDSQYRFKGN